MVRNKFPYWLKKRINYNKDVLNTTHLLQELELNTVCQDAACPNLGECFANKTATFLIMGNVCTRNCKFCAVKSGAPQKLDPEEPLRVAKAVDKLDLKHAVITSVSRDDLTDGGARHFCKVIEKIRSLKADIVIEILTPDFNFNKDSLRKIVKVSPDVFNHNLETVPRLYSKVRPEASYERSLKVLNFMSNESRDNIITKSGIMLGLGEGKEEVFEVLEDLRQAGCKIITIGQYLQPSSKHVEVKEFVEPEQFDNYKKYAESLSFKFVVSAPFVRSSYHAQDFSDKFI